MFVQLYMLIYNVLMCMCIYFSFLFVLFLHTSKMSIEEELTSLFYVNNKDID